VLTGRNQPYRKAVGNRGPIDAGEIRQVYRDMCSNWINNGILPENIHLT